MRPQPGESPLSLAFAVAALVMGFVWGAYLVLYMARELRARQLELSSDPAPPEHLHPPHLQEDLDALYMLRGDIRTTWAKRDDLPKHPTLEKTLSYVDRAIGAGTELAKHLDELSVHDLPTPGDSPTPHPATADKDVKLQRLQEHLLAVQQSLQLLFDRLQNPETPTPEILRQHLAHIEDLTQSVFRTLAID